MKALLNKFTLVPLAAAATLSASPAFAIVTPGENGDQTEYSLTGNDYQGIADNIDATEVVGIIVMVGAAIAMIRVARMGVKAGLGMIR